MARCLWVAPASWRPNIPGSAVLGPAGRYSLELIQLVLMLSTLPTGRPSQWGALTGLVAERLVRAPSVKLTED